MFSNPERKWTVCMLPSTPGTGVETPALWQRFNLDCFCDSSPDPERRHLATLSQSTTYNLQLLTYNLAGVPCREESIDHHR
jgi:hypothetical protein